MLRKNRIQFISWFLRADRPARRELILIGRLISWVRRFRRNRFLFNGFVAPFAVATGPVPVPVPFGCGLRFRLALDLGGDLFAHLGPILGFLEYRQLAKTALPADRSSFGKFPDRGRSTWPDRLRLAELALLADLAWLAPL
jgi:hypothetical protein